jgi:hypothetical protein
MPRDAWFFTAVTFSVVSATCYWRALELAGGFAKSRTRRGGLFLWLALLAFTASVCAMMAA